MPKNIYRSTFLFYIIFSVFFISSCATQKNSQRLPASANEDFVAVRDSEKDSAKDDDKDDTDDEAESYELVEIARSPADRAGMVTCAYTQLLEDQLKSTSDEDLKVQIDTELKAAREDLDASQGLGHRVKRLKRLAIRDLEILSHATEPRREMNKVFTSACDIGVIAGGAAIRTTALAASVITSASLFPIRFIYRFGRGLFTRNQEAKPGPQTTYLELLGHATGRSLPATPAYKVIRQMTLGTTNPLLVAAVAIPLIDFQAAFACENPNPKNEALIKFCERYRTIKDFATDESKEGTALGRQLRKEINDRVAFRSQTEISQRVCRKDPRKQINIAKRVIERYSDRWKSRYPAIQALTVIAPPPGGCVSVGVELKADEDLVSVSAGLGSVSDGLQLSYKNGKFPAPTAPNWADTHADVCVLLQEAKNGGATDRANKNMGEMLSLGLNPARFSKPSPQEIEVPDDKMVREPVTATGRLRNVIFTLSMSSEEKQEYETIKPEVERIGKQLKKESKTLRHLYQAKSVEECRGQVSKSGFDYAHYRELQDSQKKFQIAEKMQQTQMMTKSVKSAGKMLYLINTLKHDWEMMPVNRIQDILDQMKAPDIGNVIIASHGRSNGKLVDSNMDEMPTTAFQQISPSLMTLSFYSCFSDKLFDVYSLKDKMAKGPSYHKLRSVFSVSHNDLFDGTEFAPIPGVGTFLEAVDKRIDKMEVGNQRVQSMTGHELQDYASPPVCSIELREFEVSKGSFGFVMNRRFVGIASSDRLVEHLEFPCDWMDGTPNTLTIQNQSLTQLTTLRQSGYKIVIKRGSDMIDLGPSENFPPRADGGYSGSKYHFKTTL